MTAYSVSGYNGAGCKAGWSLEGLQGLRVLYRTSVHWGPGGRKWMTHGASARELNILKQ